MCLYPQNLTNILVFNFESTLFASSSRNCFQLLTCRYTSLDKHSCSSCFQSYQMRQWKILGGGWISVLSNNYKKDGTCNSGSVRGSSNCSPIVHRCQIPDCHISKSCKLLPHYVDMYKNSLRPCECRHGFKLISGTGICGRKGRGFGPVMKQTLVTSLSAGGRE